MCRQPKNQDVLSVKVWFIFLTDIYVNALKNATHVLDEFLILF
jgi:hypothetical protein